MGEALEKMGFTKQETESKMKSKRYCQHCKKAVAHSEANCYKNPTNRKEGKK